MTILHLLSDEKVSDHVIDMFEAASPGNNVYLVSVPAVSALRFIQHKDKVVCCRLRHWRDCRELREAKQYDAVISYGMQVCFAGFVAATPPGVPVVWSPVGSEIAEMAEFRDQLPPSGSFGERLVRIYKRVRRWLRHDIRHGHCRLDDHRRLAIRRCNFIMMAANSAVAMLKERLRLNAVHLPWTYYVADAAAESAAALGHGILAGNAASPANEHHELFALLARVDVQGREVFVPLSYGEPRYRERALAWGKQYLGDSFQPLLNFLPREEYGRLVAGCDIAIFANRRLQAFGNAIIMLAQGSRVFMRAGHPTLAYFRELGLRVSTIEEQLVPGNPDALRPLEEQQRVTNMQIIARNFSRAAVEQMTRNVVHALEQWPGSARQPERETP